MKKLIFLIALILLFALPALAEYEIDGARSIAFESGENALLAAEPISLRTFSELACTLDGEPVELTADGISFTAEIEIAAPAQLTLGDETILLFPDEESMTDYGAWIYTDAVYIAIVVGEDGSPIPGAMLNVCDETTCTMLVTDKDGRAEFIRAPYPYSVHVLRAPEGYQPDPSQEFLFEETGGELTIVLPNQ